MTVSDSTNKIAYTSNGTTKNFAVPFYFIQKSDLRVYRKIGDAEKELLKQDIDYTVAGTPANQQDGVGYVNGGTVVMTNTPEKDTRIIILREVENTQLTNYEEAGTFPAELHELALDKLTMQVQQLVEEIGRAVKVDVFSSANPAELVENIEVLYSIRDEMQSLADDLEALNALYADLSAIDALVAMDAELRTLHAKLSELLAVYAKLTAVQTVADNVADVTLAALEMGAIKDAPNQASLAAARAESARVYAEGTDAEVAALGGVRSAKEWSKSVSTFARPGETVRIPVEANYYLPAGCVKKDGSVYAANGVFKDFYDNYLKVLSGQTHFSTECLNNYPSSLDTATGICDIAAGNTADVIEFTTAVSLTTATVSVKVTISGVADSTLPYILFAGTCRSNWSSRGPYLALVKDDDGNPYLAAVAPSKTPSFANASATVALSEFLSSPTLYDGTYEIMLKLAANNTDVEFHVSKSGYETVVTDPASYSLAVKRVFSRSGTSVIGGTAPTTNGVTIDLTSLKIMKNGVVSYPCIAEITIPRLQTCTFTEYAAEIEAAGVCEKFGVSDTQFKVPTAADGSNELVVLSTGSVMRSALDWSEWMTEATSMKADIAKKQDLSANFLTNSATSGTVNLLADKVYRHMVTGAVTYVLPAVTTNDTCHQIRLMLSMETAQTINWGTTHYVNGVAPDVSKAGSYEVIYTQQGNAWWWVGVIYLGG